MQLASNSKNYYEILGIDREASVKDIKKSYHELARLYHPDSNFYADIIDDKLNAEQIELFKIITSAYHTLIDPQKREQYDNTIMPMARDSGRQWDDKEGDDFWNKKSALSSSSNSTGRTVSPKRQRAATFGQTGARPFKSTLHDGELKRSTVAAQSISSIRKSQDRSKKFNKMLVPVVVAALAGCAVCFIGLFVLSPAEKTEVTEDTVINNTINDQQTDSWRDNLNN